MLPIDSTFVYKAGRGTIQSMNTRAFIVLTAALALTAPVCASAQNYAYQAQRQNGTHAVRTSIVSGVYANNITLDNGMTVRMHHGTIINPRGVTLYPGMRVRVTGWRQDHTHFTADVVDLVHNRR